MMMDENEMERLETIRNSHEKGQKCMDAVIKVLGEKRKGELGINMNPENIGAIASVSMNLLKWLICSLDDPFLLKTLQTETEANIKEAFEIQQLKLKSTVN
jgi:hypothetical protein